MSGSAFAPARSLPRRRCDDRDRRPGQTPLPALADHRALPAARARRVRALRAAAHRPGSLVQPVRLERAHAAHRLRRARQLHEGAERLGLPGRGLAQRPHRLPVPDRPDPVRALAGAAAQPALPGPDDPAHPLLRAIRALRGHHRHRLPAAPLPGRPASTGVSRRPAWASSSTSGWPTAPSSC